MPDPDIVEIARRSGVAASTLRYYEEKKLIASTGRRGLRRTFDPSVVDRLALIALGKAAGFPLDEIAAMFAPDGTPRIERDTLAARAKAVDRTIRRLTALRDGLRHAAACPAPSHLECPTFRRLMQDAATGRLDATPRDHGMREPTPAGRRRAPEAGRMAAKRKQAPPR